MKDDPNHAVIGENMEMVLERVCKGESAILGAPDAYLEKNQTCQLYKIEPEIFSRTIILGAAKNFAFTRNLRETSVFAFKFIKFLNLITSCLLQVPEVVGDWNGRKRHEIPQSKPRRKKEIWYDKTCLHAPSGFDFSFFYNSFLSKPFCFLPGIILFPMEKSIQEVYNVTPIIRYHA